MTLQQNVNKKKRRGGGQDSKELNQTACGFIRVL